LFVAVSPAFKSPPDKVGLLDLAGERLANEPERQKVGHLKQISVMVSNNQFICKAANPWPQCRGVVGPKPTTARW
jgi:hypothetical protein